MSETNPVQQLQKICRIWSRRREEQIAVRISYGVREQNGCKIYSLNQIEDVDP